MTDTANAAPPQAWPSNQTIEATDADLRSQVESFIEDATEDDRHFLNEAFYVRERSHQGSELGLFEAIAEMMGISADDLQVAKDKRLNKAATDLHQRFNSVEGFRQFESQALNLVNALCWLSPSARRMAVTSVVMQEPKLLIDALAYGQSRGRFTVEPEEADEEVDALVKEAMSDEPQETEQ